MNDNSYKTLRTAVSATIFEKKSEFIGFAAPAKTEEEALFVLDNVRKKHRTATHNVFAYSLRNGARTRYSDDGEPAKTAGLPVLDVIRHSGLEDIIIVVTRYFGGTLLGTGGLVRAYTQSAKAALEQAEIVSYRECVEIDIAMDYSFYEKTRRMLEGMGAHLSDAEFKELVSLRATLLKGGEKEALKNLSEISSGKIVAKCSAPVLCEWLLN